MKSLDKKISIALLVLAAVLTVIFPFEAMATVAVILHIAFIFFIAFHIIIMAPVVIPPVIIYELLGDVKVIQKLSYKSTILVFLVRFISTSTLTLIVWGVLYLGVPMLARILWEGGIDPNVQFNTFMDIINYAGNSTFWGTKN
jgi:hypothetical protein